MSTPCRHCGHSLAEINRGDPCPGCGARLAYHAEVDPVRAWTTTIRTDCSRCRYDLTGLCVGSNCPECGLLIGTVSDQGLPPSGFATASLVMGILAFPGCLAFGIGTFICGGLAVIFWLVTGREVRNSYRSAASLSTARAGAICGIIAMVIVGAFWVIALL